MDHQNGWKPKPQQFDRQIERETASMERKAELLSGNSASAVLASMTPHTELMESDNFVQSMEIKRDFNNIYADQLFSILSLDSLPIFF